MMRAFMDAGIERADVAVIGGGLFGAMTAVVLRRRGLNVVVFDARPEGTALKHVVGEAITEGSSVFLRHEIGIEDWLRENTFRKFGFDFLLAPPADSATPARMEDCHELLLSLTTLENIPPALDRLIPTYHVDRVAMDAHVVELAKREGADFRHGAPVRRVDVGERDHVVHYDREGAEHALACRWVVDCSGRRCVLGRQLGLHAKVEELPTAAIWNRFEGVEADPQVWSTFEGIDRRRHTVHFAGEGFWIWWIHQAGGFSSVGVSYDTRKHQPDVKAEDHGFHEMIAKFPIVAQLLRDARPLEPYQYLAHLPHRSEHWVSTRGYSLIGDAGWFVDALYSTAIETGARQIMAMIPLVLEACAGEMPCEETTAKLNEEFEYLQRAVLAHNRFKYEHAWHHPRAFFQVALYELSEIAELYHLQRKQDWTRAELDRNYRLQWGSAKRLANLEAFMAGARQPAPLRGPRLLKKSLSPGRLIYRATWPLWHLAKGPPLFFIITRLWGFVERYAQRWRMFPDFLSLMASRPTPRRGPAPLPMKSSSVSSADV